MATDKFINISNDDLDCLFGNIEDICDFNRYCIIANSLTRRLGVYILNFLLFINLRSGRRSEGGLGRAKGCFRRGGDGEKRGRAG